MEFNYHVETGPDGIRWVSVEPLMNDIVHAIDGLMKIDTEQLNEENKQVLDLKILGLRTVHEFLGSIITADNLKKMKPQEQNNEQESNSTIH